MDYYRNHSGKNYLVQKKYEYTENPSIQGMWNPFVNADPKLATAKFPVVNIFHLKRPLPLLTPLFFQDDLSKPFNMPKSASDHLIELFERQKIQSELPNSENEKLEVSKQSE